MLFSNAKTLGYEVFHWLTGKAGLETKVDRHSIRFHPRWSRYYEKDYEPETFAFLTSNLGPGDVFLDIGGHIGLFAVVGARLVGGSGQVFSFEPTPFTRSILTQTVALNGCEDIVEVRPEAVSSMRGDAEFFDTGDEASNANSLAPIKAAVGRMIVPTISIDEFVEERQILPNCIKIDVEGAELDVLRGAKEVIKKFRPSIRLGLHPQQMVANGDGLKDVWDILRDFGLTPHSDGSPLYLDDFCSKSDLFDVNLEYD